MKKAPTLATTKPSVSPGPCTWREGLYLPLALVATVLLFSSAPGCSNCAGSGSGSKGKGGGGSSSRRGRWGPSPLAGIDPLELIPGNAELVLTFHDGEKLLRTLGWVRETLEASPSYGTGGAKGGVAKGGVAKKLSTVLDSITSPFPLSLPQSPKHLAGMGLPRKGFLGAYWEDESWGLLLKLSDPHQFKELLSALPGWRTSRASRAALQGAGARNAPKDANRKLSSKGLLLGRFKSPKTKSVCYCLLLGTHALFSPQVATLYETLMRATKKPKKSAGGASPKDPTVALRLHLRREEQERLVGSMVGLTASTAGWTGGSDPRKKGLRVTAGLTYRKDGAALNAQVRGTLLSTLGLHRLPKPKALSQAGGYTTRLYLHLPPLAMRFLALKASPASPKRQPPSFERVPPPAHLSAMARVLLPKMTGEILFLGDGANELGLLVGTQGKADELVASLGAALSRVTKQPPPRNPRLGAGRSETKNKAFGKKFQRTSRKKQKNPAPFTLRKLSWKDRKAYRLETRFGLQGLPFKGSFVLTSCASGVVLGTPSLAKALARGQALPSKTPRAPKAPSAVFGPNPLLGIQSPLADPLHALDPKFLAATKEKMPPSFWAILETIRFALDSLRDHTLRVEASGPDTLALRYRLRTLHRAGHPEDDKARAVWRKALKLLYRGDDTTAARLVRSLANSLGEKHPDSPYAHLPSRLRGSWLSTALVGFSASVGVPAFLRYMKRSRATEALAELRVLALSARLYYERSGKVSRTSQVTVKSFPLGDTGWTPSSPCCKNPKKTCAPQPSAFTSPLWKALRFAPQNRFRYQYRFVGRGTGDKATFTARARGDLDCDGVYSLYSVEGQIQDGKPVIGPVSADKPYE